MSKKSSEKNKNHATTSRTNETVWKESLEDDTISEVVTDMDYEQDDIQNPVSSNEHDTQDENAADDEVVEIHAVEMPDEVQSEEEALEVEVEALIDQEELDALVSERDDLKDQLLRARAEFDNFRKRIQRESELQRKRAAEKLLRDLLPVVDNLERALNHGQDTGESGLVEGVNMVLKQFLGVLDNFHVTPIVAVGELFDPNLHDAMTQQPSETYAEGVVMNEFERGYFLGDTVLRPSKVLVSSGPPVPIESTEKTTASGVPSTDTETGTPEQGDGGGGEG